MKGRLMLEMVDKMGEKRELVSDFHFRLRDLESYFTTDQDEIIAVIGRMERVF